MKTKPIRFETAILEMLARFAGKTVAVYAFELWRDPDGGWTVNDGWRMITGSVQDILPAMRDRWEVFKVNYNPRARVSDLQDVSWGEGSALIECDCVSVFEVREVE